jgi:hypothetical protein
MRAPAFSPAAARGGGRSCQGSEGSRRAPPPPQHPPLSPRREGGYPEHSSRVARSIFFATPARRARWVRRRLPRRRDRPEREREREREREGAGVPEGLAGALFASRLAGALFTSRLSFTWGPWRPTRPSPARTWRSRGAGRRLGAAAWPGRALPTPRTRTATPRREREGERGRGGAGGARRRSFHVAAIFHLGALEAHPAVSCSDMA